MLADRAAALEPDRVRGRSSLVDPFGRAHHLFARLGDRSLRFPLRLLHGRGHDLPAEGRCPDARGARPAVLRLRRARRAQASPHRRRAAGAPTDIMALFRSLSRHLACRRLDELTLTTNGSQLAQICRGAGAAGVRRINVSLDTLDADKFRAITRWGNLGQGAGRHRRGAGGRPQGQDQHRRAQGRQRGRDRPR